MSDASTLDQGKIRMTDKSRLSKFAAALVVARRDFIAVLFSRAFFFFLLGPLFPILIGGLAGGIGGQVQREASVSQIGLAMEAESNAAMLRAFETLRPQLGGAIPLMSEIPPSERGETFDARTFLEQKRGNYSAIVTGSLTEPQITGTSGQVAHWSGTIGLLAATAAGTSPVEFPGVREEVVQTSAAAERSNRIKTAQAAQMLLFLLTMLLAGMVLSNLVEEKANKIIEILAAAIPMDAVFTGKLFAMLGVSLVGITVWGLAGGGFWLIAGAAPGGDFDPSSLPTPAVGWPAFVALAIAYFAMAYLLLGALFLTIGGLAATVREVQTLSMPVTMMQLVVWFVATYALTQPGSTLELAAVAFPLSSPFSMIARAAMQDALWPHALALIWQAFAVMLIIRWGSSLFRKRVMKSGNAGQAKTKRRWFASARKPAVSAQPAE